MCLIRELPCAPTPKGCDRKATAASSWVPQGVEHCVARPKGLYELGDEEEYSQLNSNLNGNLVDVA
ncbi:hypothetical protein TIFTF001_012199 [Ficus carica]|uniref:Uncharacterized protein n=1 Tax=Ficus carica TaxID=3494 RepID=A0AA87ZYK6_FICCA|nr:hypothetical protein TIFTF001_012199 [Ficus carica]